MTLLTIHSSRLSFLGVLFVWGGFCKAVRFSKEFSLIPIYLWSFARFNVLFVCRLARMDAPPLVRPPPLVVLEKIV